MYRLVDTTSTEIYTCRSDKISVQVASAINNNSELYFPFSTLLPKPIY